MAERTPDDLARYRRMNRRRMRAVRAAEKDKGIHTDGHYLMKYGSVFCLNAKFVLQYIRFMDNI